MEKPRKTRDYVASWYKNEYICKYNFFKKSKKSGYNNSNL